MLGVILVAAQAADIVVADFEAETYGAWTVEGEAFGPGPARGTLPHQMHVDGFLGKGLVNSIGRGRGVTFAGMPFNQQMCVPVELTLRGGRMVAEPVRGLAALRTTGESDLLEIRATFKDPAAEAGIDARGVKVLWSPEKKELRVGSKVTAPLTGLTSLHVLVDRGSVEVFANGGEVAVSAAVIPAADNKSWKAIGAASSEAHALKSTWRP